VEKLTEKEKAILIAHRHDGISLKDIAWSMGVTKQAASKIYCRAKRKLEIMGITLPKLEKRPDSGLTVATYDPMILAATIGGCR
tara:strand:- start:465 stop:716 length:252 start_codon:yes stop_codon:yes gene_type:complete